LDRKREANDVLALTRNQFNWRDNQAG